MPAAAVIPAPIAYINVVAVKKLVVEFLEFNINPSVCFEDLFSLQPCVLSLLNLHLSSECNWH